MEPVSEIVVVLGAAVRAEGEPSPALRRRIDHAAGLVLERPDSLLLLTGGVGLYPPSEAEAMARVAERGGVPRERMLLEEHAVDTGDSARRCARLLASCGHDRRSRMVIVTDAYHQRRARLAFRRVGLTAESSSPATQGGAAVHARRVLREWLGLAWYALTFWG